MEKLGEFMSNIIIIQKYIRSFIQRTKKILKHVDVKSIMGLDINKLKKYLRIDYLTDGRIEYYRSTSTKNYTLESSFMEFITTKAIVDGYNISSGNSPLDIINYNKKIGIDVACLACNSNITNEKSIIQNFKKSGNNLDKMFDEEEYPEIVSLFNTSYMQKIQKAITLYNLEHIYYLIFISCGDNIFLTAFEIMIENINNITNGGMSSGNKSIKINNFIDSSEGSVKIYKSKKRLELRLYKTVCYNTKTEKIY